MDHIVSELYKNEYNCVKLEVNTSNTIAINLYLNFKFRIIGKVKKYYNSGQDAYLMVKID